MFELMDQDEDGQVNFNEYLVKIGLLNERINLESANGRASADVDGAYDG